LINYFYGKKRLIAKYSTAMAITILHSILSIIILIFLSKTLDGKYLLVEVEETQVIEDKPDLRVLANNYDHLKEGETRTFKIDKKSKPNCKLSTDEISITKIKSGKEKTHQVVGHEAYGYIDCYPGYVSGLQSDGILEGCGIGKILMRLCFAETSIHNTAKKQENRAMKEIVENGIKKFPELAKWVSSKCSKVLFMTMTANPKTGAHVYFNSAIEAGWTEMFVKIGKWEKLYPNEGPCSVAELKKRYTAEGNMVDGSEVVKVYHEHWYFCLPKTPANTEKCTIL